MCIEKANLNDLLVLSLFLQEQHGGNWPVEFSVSVSVTVHYKVLVSSHYFIMPLNSYCLSTREIVSLRIHN